jgi:hypothetical protein
LSDALRSSSARFWVLSPTGHLVCGLAAIWTTFGVDAAGAHHYGWFVTVLTFVIIIIIAAALTITVYGFSASPDQFVAAESTVTGRRRSRRPPPSRPTGRPISLGLRPLRRCPPWRRAGARRGGCERSKKRAGRPLLGWVLKLLLFSITPQCCSTPRLGGLWCDRAHQEREELCDRAWVGRSRCSRVAHRGGPQPRGGSDRRQDAGAGAVPIE